MNRILIADDDFPIRDWLSRCCREIIRDDRIDIVTAGNGQLAYEEFENKPADIVFADIKMPVMDGLELTNKIRQKNENTYIVVLSSYDDFNFARTAFQNKVNEYVLKTEITMDYLKNIIERAKKHISVNDGSGKKEAMIYAFDELIDNVDKCASGEEMKMLLDKYNINIPMDPYFCVAVYSSDRTYDRLRLIQEDGIYKVFSVKAEMSEAICFALSGEPSLLYQFQKANAFIKRLVDFNPRHIICCSRVLNDRDNALKHITEVLKGLNYRYYTDERVFYLDKLTDYIKNYRAIDKLIIENYIKIIETKDKKNYDAVSRLVHEWFELLYKQPALDISVVKSMCQRVYDSLKETVDINNISDSSAVINKISKAEKIADMECIILEAYEKNIDSIDMYKTTSSAVKKAIKYVYSNYATIEGLPEIADEVGLNPEYFSRLFKSETGVNFSLFLNNYRLDRAEELLKNTDKRLYEIAEETGFSSLSYFSRKFKEKFGITPFEYK